MKIGYSKAEDLANRLGYDLLFVCTNDADHNSAGRCENHALVSRIVLLFKFDSKKSQPIAYPSANCGRILSDATREHQCLDSAQRCRE